MSGPRRSSFRANQVSYATVGVTQEPDVLRFAPSGFRASLTERRIGSGAERFAAASVDLLNGAFFERAGLRALTVDGSPFDVTALRGESPTVRVANAWWPLSRVEEYRVIYVIKEERRVAFALGSLSHWPVSGEQLFCVEWRDDDTVWSSITTVTALYPHWSMVLLAPILRLREQSVRVRCARALNPVKSVG